jgi:hypothetical protein
MHRPVLCPLRRRRSASARKRQAGVQQGPGTWGVTRFSMSLAPRQESPHAPAGAARRPLTQPPHRAQALLRAAVARRLLRGRAGFHTPACAATRKTLRSCVRGRRRDFVRGAAAVGGSLSAARQARLQARLDARACLAMAGACRHREACRGQDRMARPCRGPGSIQRRQPCEASLRSHAESRAGRRSLPRRSVQEPVHRDVARGDRGRRVRLRMIGAGSRRSCRELGKPQ